MTRRRSWRLGAGLAAVVMATAAGWRGFRAQASSADPDAAAVRAMALRHVKPLDTVRVPDVPNLGRYVVDRAALRVLGKALFWDTQLGSDGQSCASCHFHAGADNRSRNQVNPGFRSQVIPGGDQAFTPPLRPGYQLTAADFPFHRLADPEDSTSAVLWDSNDVVSSEGVFNRRFVAIGVPDDEGTDDFTGPGAVFSLDGKPLRNVEPRNTPPSIGAVLNHRNFWDGRARRESNGVNPLGQLDPTARLVKASPVKGKADNPVLLKVRINNASGASQADGPPLSDLEMSYAGRTFPLLGRKLFRPDLAPLALQRVAGDDSVLGPFSRQNATPGTPGVTFRYQELIQKAFDPTWWEAPDWYVDTTSEPHRLVKGTPTRPDTHFTVMEYNFSLYLGLAIPEYERLLIPGNTPFDRFLQGDLSALDAQQVQGLGVFLGKGRCINCHGGPELTNASFQYVQQEGLVERMLMGDGRVGLYDPGFYNISVRPTLEDIGLGARMGPLNLPLANSRFLVETLSSDVAARRASGMSPEAAEVGARRALDLPRVRARPAEALRLMQRVASLLENPPALQVLLAQAQGALDGGNVSEGCAALGRAWTLAKSLADPSPPRGDILPLLVDVTLLLPDPADPGPDPRRPFAPPIQVNERVAVDGAFKTPSLRNVELTAPYFHNGGQATLEQVVAFYNRGGDFPRENRENLDADIVPLGLTEPERATLVAFMRALTDERVRRDQAPFDHPELSLSNGRDRDGARLLLPAVGRGGYPVARGSPATQGTPLGNFLDPLSP